VAEMGGDGSEVEAGVISNDMGGEMENDENFDFEILESSYNDIEQ